jgi:dienelactone hydrolase
MRSIVLAATIAAACLVATPAVAQDAPPPISAFAEMPAIELATLSPSGERIAALLTTDGQRRIVLMDTALTVLRAIGAGTVKVRDLEWIGEEAVLMHSTQTERLTSEYADAGEKAEFALATIIPVDRKRAPEVIFRNSSWVRPTLYGAYGLRPTAKGWRGYFGGIEMERGATIMDREVKYSAPSLFEVDLERNLPNAIAKPAPEGFARDWLMDRDGKVAAILNFSGATGNWNIVNAAGSSLTEGRSETGQIGLVGFNAAGTGVVFSLFDEPRGETVWYEVPLGGGARTEFAAGQDIDRLYTDPYSGRVLGFTDYVAGGQTVTFFDPALETRGRKIRSAFAKLDWRIASYTPDLSKAIVRTSGNNDSGTWFLVDTVNLKAAAIGYEHPKVGARVGAISTVAYTAGDGTELDGILTLPPGLEARGLPAVILPHGGPHAQDRAEFDWWAQAIASRGYAVFQPNFRGSTNRDDAFRRAGYGEWGGKMQSDISDGLAALAAKGVVDPKRACIVGASFGGYAALAGVTLQQGIYRCAVAVAPVSDLEDMWNEDTYSSGGAFGTRTGRTAFLQQLGPRDRWAARSPLRAAARADAPILLIHGADDTVVRYAHSTRMEKALRAAGKPVSLVTLREEDHWLSRAPTRLQMLEETMAFLARHNPAE